MKKILAAVLLMITITACSNTEEPEIEAAKYNQADYVVVNTIDGSTVCKDDGCGDLTFPDLYDVTFTNLDESVVQSFLEKHHAFINQSENSNAYKDGYRLRNDIDVTLDDSLLTVYEKQYSENHPIRDSKKAFSLFVDLDTKTEMTANQLMEHYGITNEALFTKILDDTVDKINYNYLAESTTGDITAPTVSEETYIANRDDYVSQNVLAYLAGELDNDQWVVFYREDDKLKCHYDLYRVLRNVGLGAHMGAGLNMDYKAVTLN